MEEVSKFLIPPKELAGTNISELLLDMPDHEFDERAPNE